MASMATWPAAGVRSAVLASSRSLGDKLMGHGGAGLLAAMGARRPGWCGADARDLCITGLRSIASSEGMVRRQPGRKDQDRTAVGGHQYASCTFQLPGAGVGVSVDYQVAGACCSTFRCGFVASGVEYVGFARPWRGQTRLAAGFRLQFGERVCVASLRPPRTQRGEERAQSLVRRATRRRIVGDGGRCRERG